MLVNTFRGIIYFAVYGTHSAFNEIIYIKENFNIMLGILSIAIKGEPELTDPFNLLINVKLRMLWNWNFFYLKEEHFYGNIVS